MGKAAARSSFLQGFVLSLVVLLGFNLWSYTQIRAIANDPTTHLYGAECGFPLTFYIYSTGYIVGVDQFLWSGIVGDVLLWLVIAVLIGMFYSQPFRP